MANKKSKKKQDMPKDEIQEKTTEKKVSTNIVKKEEVSNDTTSVSVIDTQELKELINEDLGIEDKKKDAKKHHVFVNTILIVLMLVSFIFFGLGLFDKSSSIQSIINSLLLTVFTILFVVISITYNRRKKGMIFFSSLLLLGYFLLGINSHFQLIKTPINTVPNFQGKSLTSVIKWAEKNKINIHQEYEYSDMIPEYRIISQDISNKSLKDIKELTISISEGANPKKEIIVPNMITWDSKRVLNFIKKNYLSNVVVDFVESDQAKDTVIEQNTNGSFRRDDELKLTFSYGEELGFDEVTLIDFTNNSKFEVEFFMKQHKLNYELEDDFSSKIKKGFAMKQSVQAGDKVKVDDEKIKITISKGPKIKVPDLSKMSIAEVTEWAINNKLKLNFEEEYDDSIKENRIVKADYNKGDIIEQGTVVKVTLSRGILKMPKFKSLNDFYQWANKYNIDYEEKHEFSDKVKAGEVIEYSHKTGQAIKKNDTITVTISDGVKKKVPDLDGLTKSEAISKLDKADLNYNFVYKNSNKKKNIVIGQSIKAGSEISSGTTITVTLSNGEKEEDEDKTVDKRKTTDNNKSNNTNNNNSNKPSSNDSDSGNNNNSTPTPQPDPEPTPSCNSCTVTGLKNVIRDNLNGGYGAVAGALRSSIQSQCPGVKVNINSDSTSGKASGSFISGFQGGNTDSCSTVSITLAS